ncbi:DNA-formamidopyrimidine glycosylase family protein [Argonema antarcticum]|uniref:DNA-formamidopyrimidine glycosylase family protein n=1 Tax=Argonema antarcticum TaxID=2942763 RepID=UPI0020113846|nr:DNA-formamidopyrimidine glycosylase family protein [Argonema antarcticum]MCL1473385.1 hypothetical protein [Argonema antarcticum A004/B2]
MPELPDLELYTRNLSKIFNGDKVEDVLIIKDKKLNANKDEVAKVLKNQILEQITREGKEVWFKFSSGINIAVHLMLKGRFDHVETDGQVKYKVALLKFEKNQCLVISDQLGWATITFSPPKPSVPDALSETFNLSYLREKLSERKSDIIKAFLLNQNIVRGIGNAYADEILWDCKIAPASKCGRLPDTAVEALHSSIKKVLENAIQELFRATPNAINGEYRDFLIVHNPAKKETPSGYEIRTDKIASKTTYYTEEQILYE